MTKNSVSAAPATDAKSTFLKHLNDYKEFIAIIVAAISGFWIAIDYFVTQKQFSEQMINNQCLLISNVSKLSHQINENYYQYMRDKIVTQALPLQQKEAQKIPWTLDEAKNMKELQDSLETLKKSAQASNEREQKYDDAIQTGSCSKLITFSN